MEPLRAFVAIELPEPIQAFLAQLQDKLRKGGTASVKWVAPENIHLTLKFLGNIDASEVPRLSEALSEAVKEVVPFNLELGDAGAFPNIRSPRVVWIGLAGELEWLRTLHKNIEQGLIQLGFAPEERGFSPHLTLGRVREGASPEERRRLGEKVSLLKPAANSSFRVGSISLMKSTLTREGAIYNRLASFALGSR